MDDAIPKRESVTMTSDTPPPPPFPDLRASVQWQFYVDSLVENLTSRVDRQFTASEHAVEVALTQVATALGKSEELQVERVEAVRREVKTALDAANVAIQKSDTGNDKRFTSFDELRHTLQQQAVLFVSREVADSQFQSIKEQLDALEGVKANEVLQRERIEALRRETAALQVSNTTAINKSDEATEKRFHAVNMFREQLADQATRFIPREVVDAQTTEFRNQIAALTARIDQTGGSSAAGQRITTLAISVVGVVLAIIIFLANYVFKT
jgi:hypothetical protein